MSFYKWLKNLIWKLRIRIFFSVQFFIYEFELLDEKTAAPPKIKIENGFANINDADELSGIDPEKNKQIIIEKLVKGDLCFVAKFNGKIVSYLWASTKDGDLPHSLARDIIFLVPDGSVYSYDSYTVPEYRGQGISSALADFAGSHLLREGRQFLYCLVRTNNIRSVKVNEKFDPRILGILTFRSILGKHSITASASDENYEKIKKYFNIEEIVREKQMIRDRGSALRAIFHY